jgi:P pilus assembly chaperone PapD
MFGGFRMSYSIRSVSSFLFGASLLLGTAYAQIGVTPDILNFVAKQPLAQNILVQNAGKNIDYVDVTPYVVEHPGTKKEKQVRVYNPSVSGIIVSPSRLAIPAGQQRYVRIMLTKPLGDSDRIYRVNFVPKIAGLKSVQTIKGREIGLHLIVGYGVLITARAAHPTPNLIFSKTGKELSIKNTGNSNAVVTVKQCKNKVHCTDVFAKRFYAGNQSIVKLPLAKPVTITTAWLDNDHIKTHVIK